MGDGDRVRAEWDRLAAAFDMADADVTDSGDDDTELNFYLQAQDQACLALMMAPAPDVAALLRKLELFRKEHLSDHKDHEELFNAMIEDARRLSGRPTRG